MKERAFNATQAEVGHIPLNPTGQLWRPVTPLPTPRMRPYGMKGEQERVGWKWKHLDTRSDRTLECALLRDCPFGVPGDRLHIQEIWEYDSDYDRMFWKADIDDDIELEITAVQAQQVKKMTDVDHMAAGLVNLEWKPELWIWAFTYRRLKP